MSPTAFASTRRPAVVSPADAERLDLLGLAFGRRPAAIVESWLGRRATPDRAVTPDGQRLIAEAVTRGLVERLVRRGGWQRRTTLAAGSPVTGRLWERSTLAVRAWPITSQTVAILDAVRASGDAAPSRPQVPGPRSFPTQTIPTPSSLTRSSLTRSSLTPSSLTPSSLTPSSSTDTGTFPPTAQLAPRPSDLGPSVLTWADDLPPPTLADRLVAVWLVTALLTELRIRPAASASWRPSGVLPDEPLGWLLAAGLPTGTPPPPSAWQTWVAEEMGQTLLEALEDEIADALVTGTGRLQMEANRTTVLAAGTGLRSVLTAYLHAVVKVERYDLLRSVVRAGATLRRRFDDPASLTWAAELRGRPRTEIVAVGQAIGAVPGALTEVVGPLATRLSRATIVDADYQAAKVFRDFADEMDLSATLDWAAAFARRVDLFA